MKQFIIALVFTCLMSANALAQDRPLYLDPAQPIDKRIEDLLSRLTVEEKVSFCHANSIFATAGVPRLGIPELTMDDGPMGVREEVGNGFRVLNRVDDYATAMPSPIALAATWDVDLAQSEGQAIGQEALFRGKHIMLNPAINMQRTPLCGRNFEYFGEDPYLSGRLAVSFINGEQAEGVAACVKHFAVNNQETQRNSLDVDLDERTLREIYLPAFEAAVKEGNVLSVMGAYNRVRGAYCCESDYLLNKILKQEWAFKGIVISDWGAVHSTDGAALGGLDAEMGSRPPYETNFLATPFLDGVKSGKYSMAVLDDKVRRHLYLMFKLKLLDPPPAQRQGSLSTREHQIVSRTVAEQGMVLLKNERNILPLDLAKTRTIAVIGDTAVQLFTHAGFGATVKSFYEVTPLQGIIERVGNRATVSYSAGYLPPAGRGGRRGRGASSAPDVSAGSLLDRAVAAAKSADVVIFVGGLGHSPGGDDEGTDKRDLKLFGNQDEIIPKIVAANPNTVVVMVGGSPVDMPWLSQVPSVLQAWYGGMEAGNALARVLLGDVNPSGKLPCTFPKQLSDSPAHALNAFPGVNGAAKYEEGLLIGYRWFDTKNIDPLFAFGHGLSYTTFEYSNLIIKPGTAAGNPLIVQFDIANTGQRPGAEVAQLYVQDVQSTLPRPMKELKGFRKIQLAPGQKQTVTIPLDNRALSYYDPDKAGWLAEAGDFVIHIGSSSRDIRLKGEFHLANMTFEK